MGQIWKCQRVRIPQWRCDSYSFRNSRHVFEFDYARWEDRRVQQCGERQRGFLSCWTSGKVFCRHPKNSVILHILTKIWSWFCKLFPDGANVRDCREAFASKNIYLHLPRNPKSVELYFKKKTQWILIKCICRNWVSSNPHNFSWFSNCRLVMENWRMLDVHWNCDHWSWTTNSVSLFCFDFKIVRCYQRPVTLKIFHNFFVMVNLKQKLNM